MIFSMSRFFTLVFSFSAHFLSAQAITWTTPCSDTTFCLNQGSCSEGDVMLVEQAVTTCFSSPLLNYTYKIDLNNDGSTDIQSNTDTINEPFPLGTHKVTWRANDNCGNLAQCTYLFTIEDCQPPALVCISSLTQNIEIPVCAATVDATDFVISATDNCPPGGLLQYGIRRAGDGDGFPAQTSVTFDLCELGSHSMEIWVKDENDLDSRCFTNVTVQDNSGDCGCVVESDLTLQGCLRTADSTKLNFYTLRADLTGTPPQGAPFSLFIQSNLEDSCYSRTFSTLPEADYEIVVRAKRNGGWLDGVSTFDLLQTTKHILNIEPFQTVWQRLAADVNGSNSVTSFDIVETRKLILGIYDTFPAAPSWRFFRPVPDPSNLLSAVKDTYQITLTNLVSDTILDNLDFIGVKMGDVNLSAMFTHTSTDDRSGPSPLIVRVSDRFLAAGETAVIPVRLAEATTLGGWQLAFAADPALASVEGVEGLPDEDFLISGNTVRALWFDAGRKSFLPNEIIFSLKIKTLQPVSLSQLLSFSNEKLRAEAYAAPENGTEQIHPLQLQFSENTSDGTTFFLPQPNPFSDETVFHLLLNQSSEVRLELFDLLGRQVFLKKMEMVAGHQSFVLPAVDLPNTGVFLYRIWADGKVFSGRLVRE